MIIFLCRRHAVSPAAILLKLFFLISLIHNPLISAQPFTIQIPFERDENGSIILKLELDSGTKRIQTRWLLDTGSELTHLNSAIDGDYYKVEEGTVNVRDAHGDRLYNQVRISIKKLIISGVEIKNIQAARTNFEFISKYEDEPIDGVLGMNFFVNHIITINFQENVLLITNKKIAINGQKLYIKNHGVPMCRLRCGKQIFNVVCDTGWNGSIALPKIFDSSIKPTGKSYSAGAFSNAYGLSIQPMKLEWLGRHWFSKSAFWAYPNITESKRLVNGLIGLKFWDSVAIVTFDFIRGQVIIPNTCIVLPLKKKAGPFIPVYWDRKDPMAPLLVVEEVTHLEPYERLGFESGDIVISIDGKAEGLSRRRFQDASLTPGSHVGVRRKGQVINLTIPVIPATPPAPAPPYPAPLPPNSP